MKFRTEYEAKKGSLILDPAKPAVLVGSCFSQNMAIKMKEHGWDARNPLGTLYNPFSILKSIDMMADEKTGLATFEKSLFQANGIWNSWWFDSSLSSLRKEDCCEEFLIRKEEFIKGLQNGGCLIVTFGTSICYYRYEDRLPVGNCHKQPASLFYRERMSVTDVMVYSGIWMEKLSELFPGLKVIFTVSPVRHLKDGFEGNARSKAILLLGVEDICRFNSGCSYFPAFEILNDDLRDYRFYASDLAHPSQEAIDYIWEKFCETYIDEKGMQILKEGEKKYRRSRHIPLTGALGKPLSEH